jgi:hypothetical protein
MFWIPDGFRREIIDCNSPTAIRDCKVISFQTQSTARTLDLVPKKSQQ